MLKNVSEGSRATILSFIINSCNTGERVDTFFVFYISSFFEKVRDIDPSMREYLKEAGFPVVQDE